MLDIKKEQNGGKLTLYLKGRLDTNTAPQMEENIKDSLEGVTELILDMEGLEYISSAGLRVILFAKKTMDNNGGMKVINSNPDVKDVFAVTGFLDIIDLE
ncbi:MAG: STAS domain-containing protein [Lachnospiraceae bacterium]|nr:STAS domain-containing protein [Lachnospiraceae bacterium]